MNMSLGVKGRSDEIEKYVSRVTREGAPVVASAGNDQTDACLFTPAWMPLAITVSATNIIDELYISTNNGECVDMLAPGEEVLSAYPGGRKRVKSGSSPCKPCYRHHIEQNSNKSPQEIKQILVGTATNGTIKLRKHERKTPHAPILGTF